MRLSAGVHLVGDGGARLQAEHLAHGGAGRRSRLDDHVLGGIVQGLPHGGQRRMGVERGGRAAVDALPAVDADGVGQRDVLEGGDLHPVGAVGGLQHPHLLHVDAGAHATAAADALVHVADDRVARVVHGHGVLHVAEAELVDAVLLGQGLQLAVAVADAGVAVAAVLGEQQVEHVAAGDAHRLGVGVDLDGRGDGIGARGLQVALPLHLDHADAADAGDFQVGVVAEGGDAHAQALGRLEDGGAHGHLGLDAVDGHRDGGADGVRRRRLRLEVGLEELAERGAPGWESGFIGHGSHLRSARG